MMRTAEEISKYVGAKLVGDPAAKISGVAAPGRATASDLIYVDSTKHQESAEKSAATCVLARTGARIAGKTILEASDPKLAFAKGAAWLSASAKPSAQVRDKARAEVHPTAIIASSARLAGGVVVGPYVVIEEDAEVRAGTEIGAFCFLGRGAKVGEDCHLHPRVTLYAGAQLGNRVEVHSGAVIGGDGFGYVFGEGRHWKFPQIGNVEIGDDVEIGSNSTVDRGSLETTQIGNGVKIDNLVQIAHNVRIGEHSIVAAQTGISGSTTLGKMVIVGGQVGIADHCTVEDGAILGAQAGIPTRKAIRRGQTVWGTPARPLEKFKEQYGWFARLPELAERVRKLEKNALEDSSSPK